MPFQIQLVAWLSCLTEVCPTFSNPCGLPPRLVVRMNYSRYRWIPSFANQQIGFIPLQLATLITNFLRQQIVPLKHAAGTHFSGNILSCDSMPSSVLYSVAHSTGIKAPSFMSFCWEWSVAMQWSVYQCTCAKNQSICLDSLEGLQLPFGWYLPRLLQYHIQHEETFGRSKVKLVGKGTPLSREKGASLGSGPCPSLAGCFWSRFWGDSFQSRKIIEVSSRRPGKFSSLYFSNKGSNSLLCQCLRYFQPSFPIKNSHNLNPPLSRCRLPRWDGCLTLI